MGMLCSCEKCHKTMDEKNFYTYKDGRKVEICKKCITMHIDNYDPDTYLWILEKLDVPYIPDEWNVLRDRAYEKNPDGMNGMSVIGRYLSKMKLRQWKDYGWADTDKVLEDLQKKKDAAAREKERIDGLAREQLDKGEITQSQYETLISIPPDKAAVRLQTPAERKAEKQTPAFLRSNPIGFNNAYDESNFLAEEDLPNPADSLTEDDKVYLAMKWGRLYKPNEWIDLENKYNEMMNSFDIQDSDTTGTLILICKTYLKMNQAIDCGDVEGYQKLSRVYDSLRKSAKFTAAQNKDAKNSVFDSVGELVAFCEREGGFIPRFDTDIPQDKIDVTLKDMNDYLNKLVTQDLGFGQQIETALQKIQNQKEMMATDEDYEITTDDIAEFYEEAAEQKQQDLMLQRQEV